MRLFGITIGGERKAADTWSTFRDWLQSQGSAKSGAAVTWRTALEVSTVFACARVIAEGIAQVPFKLYRDLPDGSKQIAGDNPLHALLSRQPNEFQTSFEFRETLALHLVLAGNAYVVKVRGRGGRLAELLPYQPGDVTVTRDGWTLRYRFRAADGTSVELPAEDVWHIKGPSWDGVVGLHAVRLAREAIGLALATEEHSARMFSNGARVGGILTTDATLKDDQVKLLRESWGATQGGVANAHKTAILWGGLKWQPAAMQNDEAELIEQRRYQVEEICRHLRVMPIMVGATDKTATYASVEQMMIAHVVHTLGPWYARLEQSADAALLDDTDRAAGLYFRFVAAGLLRGAAKDRAEYFAKALGTGGSPAWMTQDEVRALEELNPMGGGAAALPIPTNVGGPAPEPAPQGA